MANLFIFVATFIKPIKKHPVQFKTFLFNQIPDEICPSGAEAGVLSRVSSLRAAALAEERELQVSQAPIIGNNLICVVLLFGII